jgi:hypothetical protein
MSVVERPAQPVTRNCYEIRVRGVLDEHWSDWFDGFRLQRDEPADATVLFGTVADQASLYGVLSRIRDLGLPLLSVRIVDEHTWEIYGDTEHSCL